MYHGLASGKMSYSSMEDTSLACEKYKFEQLEKAWNAGISLLQYALTVTAHPTLLNTEMLLCVLSGL